MEISIIQVTDVNSGKKSRIVNWLSFYLGMYFAEKDYGEGVQRLCITVVLTNGLHKFEELQEMYVTKYESTFDDWSSSGEPVEGKSRFSIACLFPDVEYEKFCHVEEERRMDILVQALVKSLSNFEVPLREVSNFDQARFIEDFKLVVTQQGLYFKLASDTQVRKRFGEENFFEIDRIQESRMNIDNNTDLASMIKILLNKKKFEEEEWLERGVNPSSSNVIDKMVAVTNAFLVRLDHADVLAISDNDQRLETIEAIMDKIPWDDFESEERDFIFEEITPVLMKLEVDLSMLM